MRYLITIVCCLFACIPNLVAQFTEIAKEIGLEHVHEHLSYMGGGICVIDYDRDGWEDLVFTGGIREDKLYRNQGGYFIDVSDVIQFRNDLAFPFVSSSVISADFNNDGCSDLVFTSFNKAPNILLKNRCDGTFQTIIIGNTEEELARSIGSVVLDLENDGLLDLYIINYIDQANTLTDDAGQAIGFDHECSDNQLYHNLGEFQFQNVSQEFNASANGCALAAMSLQFDEDNLMDLYIANDFGEWIQPNELLINSSSGFRSVAREFGVDAAVYGMGIALGDCDQDAEQDLYITNLGRNVLLAKQRRNFTDITNQTGTEDEFGPSGRYTTGWGALFFDYDHDDDEDLFVANGYVPAAEFLQNERNDQNVLFEHAQNGLFVPVNIFGSESQSINRGCAYLDFDHDGDLDLVVASLESFSTNADNVLFYRNDLESQNNWLQIELVGRSSNRDGYGARIHVYSDDKLYVRQLFSGGSHASQSSKTIHLGLNETCELDSMVVFWPSGKVQRFMEVAGSQKIKIDEQANHLLQIFGEKVNCTTASTAPFSEDISITVHNGVAEIINTRSLEGEVNIVNQLGQQISYQALQTGKNQIALHNFPTGIYYLHVKISDSFITKKIMLI